VSQSGGPFEVSVSQGPVCGGPSVWRTLCLGAGFQSGVLLWSPLSLVAPLWGSVPRVLSWSLTGLKGSWGCLSPKLVCARTWVSTRLHCTRHTHTHTHTHTGCSSQQTAWQTPSCGQGWLGLGRPRLSVVPLAPPLGGSWAECGAQDPIALPVPVSQQQVLDGAPLTARAQEGFAPVATFAASPVCPEPAPGLTVSYKMGSELETAMETLINVFHAHSGKEGDKYKLSKKELKELLQTELSGFLDAQKDADAVDKVMKELDENGDGEVDFQEYVVLVAALTVACNNFFWENS
uniref:Protein S100-A1 n=1 Tax=Monodon monoceros TaxID=40151 RepID=A0A8C6ALN3_MONMO